MSKYKIVFKDGEREKVIFGFPDFNSDSLLKVKTDKENTVYINKSQIVFIKEIKERGIL